MSLPSLLGLYHGDQGRFAAAAPSLQQPPFQGQAVYLFDQSWYRARGLVVGRLYPEFERLPRFLQNAGIPVYWGGPVEERDAVFVVTIKDGDGLPEVRPWDDVVREIPNILDDIRRYPDTYMVFAGYAGWGFLDFEEEKQRKAWLVAPYDARLWSPSLGRAERVRRIYEQSLDKKHPSIALRQKS